MLRKVLKRQLNRYKNLIYSEADYMKGFMSLLMKPRNTGLPWTREELRALKACLQHLAHYIPVMMIFLLPFGSLLLPVLAEALDRRRTKRS